MNLQKHIHLFRLIFKMKPKVFDSFGHTAPFGLIRSFTIACSHKNSAFSEEDTYKRIERLSDTNRQIMFKGKSDSDKQLSLILDFVANNSSPTDEQWKELAEKLLSLKMGFINPISIHGKTIDILANAAKLDTIRNYLMYLKRNRIKINTGIILSYLQACFKCSNDVTDQDKRIIITMANHVLKEYELLDEHTGIILIRGLSLTSEWRRSFDIMEKLRSNNKKISLAAYSSLIRLCAMHGELSLMWPLFEEIYGRSEFISETTLDACLEAFSDDPESARRLLQLIQLHDFKPSMAICNRIAEVFAKFGPKKLIGTFSTVDKYGVCSYCKRKLQRNELTDEEFNTVRDEFLKKGLVGNDVFTKSTPEEMQSFFDFVKKEAPFDVIIDGLNVCYMSGTGKRIQEYTHLLSNTIRNFRDQRKSVFVIGKNHMKKWPLSLTKGCLNNAKFFFTHDLSNDDPFLIYAALYSGQNSFIVTRDLLRTHKYKLISVKNKMLFKRWQQSHQFRINYVTSQGRVFLNMPIAYLMTAQESSDGAWHIPYIEENGDLKDSYSMHKNWLCLHR